MSERSDTYIILFCKLKVHRNLPIVMHVWMFWYNIIYIKGPSEPSDSHGYQQGSDQASIGTFR